MYSCLQSRVLSKRRNMIIAGIGLTVIEGGEKEQCIRPVEGVGGVNV